MKDTLGSGSNIWKLLATKWTDRHIHFNNFFRTEGTLPHNILLRLHNGRKL